VIRAINKRSNLSYNLPNTPEEIEKASDGFKYISSHDVMEGCVGAIDGILLRTITPPKKSVGHVKSFFSGHYYAYGLNILAACDHQCRFLYVACQAPGGSNDITAYKNSTLPSYVEGLPISRFIVGDNAYVPSEHIFCTRRIYFVCSDYFSFPRWPSTKLNKFLICGNSIFPHLVWKKVRIS